jgi:dienelactone hydrolase
MRRVVALVCLCLGLTGLAPAWAQTVSVAQLAAHFAKEVNSYPALRFASEAGELGFLGARANNIYRPQGQGPFPAVVLVHTCGGLELHITSRARDLLDAGFVVLVQDSQGPRGIRSCDEFRAWQVPVVSKDAYSALRHLSQMKEVDAERIYLVGFSLGSFVAAAVGSPETAKSLGADKRFRASVGWYGSCAQNTPRSRWQLLAPDTDRPVLLLLAGKDTETPINECFPLLEQMKADGKPASWHVYADATHAWDKSNPQRGYVHSVATTSDAVQKTIEFLRKN